MLKRILKYLIGLFLVCLALYAGLTFLSKQTELETIIVEGSGYYTDQEIINRVVTEKTDYFTPLLYLRCKWSGMEQIPFVEYVDVKMVDRHTIKLTVYEKVITGCVKIMRNYLYFDRDGIVVESLPARRAEVPIVTGLKFDHLILYEELQVQDRKIFATILDITRLIQKYELPVNEIAFGDNLEVELVCNEIKVQLGRKEMYDEPIAALVSILPKAGEMKENGKILILDMRDYTPGARVIATYEGEK